MIVLGLIAFSRDDTEQFQLSERDRVTPMNFPDLSLEVTQIFP